MDTRTILRDRNFTFFGFGLSRNLTAVKFSSPRVHLARVILKPSDAVDDVSIWGLDQGLYLIIKNK